MRTFSRHGGSRHRGPRRADRAAPSALEPLSHRKRCSTSDVDVDWILNREYIRIHEVSREVTGKK